MIVIGEYQHTLRLCFTWQLHILLKPQRLCGELLRDGVNAPRAGNGSPAVGGNFGLYPSKCNYEILMTRQTRYEYKLYTKLRTFIYRPKRRGMVVQTFAGGLSLLLPQNSSNRFVISHARGNYKLLFIW